MEDRIAITGTGIISAIGLDEQETLHSLQAERSGIGVVKYLETSCKEFPVGEVQMSNVQMQEELGIGYGEPVTRSSLMGLMAMRQALQGARLSGKDIAHVAFVNGTTVGGMDKTEQYYNNYLNDNTRNEYINLQSCGVCSEVIADYFGSFGLITTVSTACSSSANSIVVAANLIRSGRYDIVIAGGCECLTKFHLNGFNSLMILDKRPCKPFDKNRNGLNLGEGAAYLVLETETSARQRKVEPLAILSGYGNRCDAYHQTATSPEGEGYWLAICEAMRSAGMKAGDIDYVNAHGTGTHNNDGSESAAFRRIFKDALPPVSSTKPFTGHTTSASGAIEAIICILAIRNNFIPGNLNWESIDEGCIIPTTHTIEADLTNVMSNSFGFGGNDTSIILSKWKGQWA